MRSAMRLAAIVSVLFVAAGALADGMIVPVRPEIRVRGHWAVKYHHVNITVRDQVASVNIDQEFVNTGSGMIEVEYLFPVPPDAAIDSMTMVVDGKEYAARLLKAEEARRIYENIVRRKKDPALLEYAGFGLYKTRAFPLRAGKPCKVIVTYKNVCRKDNDLVEVWYPLNTEKFSAKAIDSVRVSVDIKSKVDVTAVYSPTHDLKVDRKGPRRVVATYEEKKTLPTTDFQVYYKAANEAVGATFLSHQPKARKDGYFLVLVSPNVRVAKKSVVAKDVVVVFDHSGSMSGRKLTQAKEALRFVLNNLNSEDRFNVIAYSDAIEPFFQKGLVAAGKINVQEALDTLDRVEATGGTNIHDALLEGMNQFGDTRRPGYLLFLTDGLPTVGNRKEKEIISHAGEANKSKARLFAFGVGYDVNVRLLDKLVRGNHGRSDYVKPKEPIETKISSLYAKIKNPVMTDMKVRIERLKIRDMYPRQMGDLFEGDQILLAGRYSCRDVTKLKKRGGRYHTQLVVTGLYEGKERTFEYLVQINPGGKKLMYSFVEKLWAVRRVGYLLDQIQLNGESKELIDELVRLSRDYGIMTPYTSFLADETGRLNDVKRLRERASAAAGRDFGGVVGGRAQKGAINRRILREADKLPAPTAPGTRGRKIGHSSLAKYEAAEAEVLEGFRQAGDTPLYRRGKLWIAPSAAGLDPEKDKDKIKIIERFTKEYFDLIRRNTVAENRILASQRQSEEILIRLRDQVYRIK